MGCNGSKEAHVSSSLTKSERGKHRRSKRRRQRAPSLGINNHDAEIGAGENQDDQPVILTSGSSAAAAKSASASAPNDPPPSLELPSTGRHEEEENPLSCKIMMHSVESLEESDEVRPSSPTAKREQPSKDATTTPPTTVSPAAPHTHEQHQVCSIAEWLEGIDDQDDEQKSSLLADTLSLQKEEEEEEEDEDEEEATTTKTTIKLAAKNQQQHHDHDNMSEMKYPSHTEQRKEGSAGKSKNPKLADIFPKAIATLMERSRNEKDADDSDTQQGVFLNNEADRNDEKPLDLFQFNLGTQQQRTAAKNESAAAHHHPVDKEDSPWTSMQFTISESSLESDW